MKKYIVIRAFVVHGVGPGRLMLPNDIVYASEPPMNAVWHLWDYKTRVYLGHIDKAEGLIKKEKEK